MAQYRHLPIYRLTYELLQRVMVVCKDFSREYKFTLGQKIKDEVIEMVVLIYRASSSENKQLIPKFCSSACKSLSYFCVFVMT